MCTNQRFIGLLEAQGSVYIIPEASEPLRTKGAVSNRLKKCATLHNLRQNLQNDIIIVSYDSKNENVAVVAIELWILQP